MKGRREYGDKGDGGRHSPTKREEMREEEREDERQEMRGQGRWWMGREGLKRGYMRREVKSVYDQAKR